MAKKINYPLIKKMAFEAFRAFFIAAGAVVVAQIQAGINVADWKNALITVGIAAVAAGVKAVGKWLRDTYGNGDYSNIVYKLPF